MHSVNKTVKYKIELSPSRRKTQGKGNESCKITFPALRPFLPEFLSIYSFTTRPFSLTNNQKEKEEEKENKKSSPTFFCFVLFFKAMKGMIPLKKGLGFFLLIFTGQRRLRFCQSAYEVSLG